ncbi:MAG: N-acetyl-gamma-glutamyl-phosphate reductase [Elusimicrobiota bacterium]|jgi:N-acetyl-gamma-glutamyl-phosphate reductase|nr:N-acetyl-gamma-glutamyl-phosphate reductase [Elusimicrobiota bacterium]
MIRAGIVGITGYTGEELLKMLMRHSGVKLCAVYGRNHGKNIANVYPAFSGLNLKICPIDAQDITKNCDVVFLALPHGVSFDIVSQLIESNIKIIDLSADFRINDVKIYEQWYNVKHCAGKYLSNAVYGLCEINGEKIRNAKLVSNPGCYPTSTLLACAPSLKNEIIDFNGIIIDSKSGISGAGRTAAKNYFNTEHPNFTSYKVAGTHRHIPEIEQELSKMANSKIMITFTPHIMPVERGMFTTVYLNLKRPCCSCEIVEAYKDFYNDTPFIKILDEDKMPSIKSVINTNYCEIALKVDKRTNKLIIVSAIDNLVKGAAGQAIQNMNIMFNLPESTGFF